MRVSVIVLLLCECFQVDAINEFLLTDGEGGNAFLVDELVDSLASEFEVLGCVGDAYKVHESSFRWPHYTRGLTHVKRRAYAERVHEGQATKRSEIMSEPEHNVHVDKRESAILQVALEGWTRTPEFPVTMLPRVQALIAKFQRHARLLYMADYWAEMEKKD